MGKRFTHFLFAYCISKNEYSVLAGYDGKKDDSAQVKKQLNAIGLLNSVFASLFSVLFFAAYALYASPSYQWDIVPYLITLLAYLFSYVLIVIGANIKIKTRNKQGAKADE